MIEQGKSTYCTFGEALEKETEIIEDQGEKQKAAIEDHENNWLNLTNLLISIEKAYNLTKIFNKLLDKMVSKCPSIKKIDL